MSFPCVETERSVVTPLNKSFISEEYVAWLNDPEVCIYLESGGNYTMLDLQEYVEQCIEKKVLFWAITLKENGKHIGNIKIDPISKRHGTGEYGILIGDRNTWGKGYAAEATIGILKYCFQELGLRKITLEVIKDNNNAVKLYKKLGFQTEGDLKEHGFYNGKLCDALRMAVFNTAFLHGK